MWTEIRRPAFYETDALGHINNTCLPQWFEAAREPLFRLFSPSLDLASWPLILARFEIDFHCPLELGREVEIRTGLARLGQTSLTVRQEAWQAGRKAVSGATVLVCFDYQQGAKKPLPEALRETLEAHLWTSPEEPITPCP